jgi:hypothetical protein
MARESKRKREERRFGKSDRLADLIMSTPIDRWAFPRAFKRADEEHQQNASLTIAWILEAVAQMQVVDATNVAEYVFRHMMAKRLLDWRSMVIQPAFDEMFIEAWRPASVVNSKGEIPFPESWPHRFGFCVKTAPAEAFLEHWGETISRRKFNTSGGVTGVLLVPVTWNSSSNGPGYLGCSIHLLLDELGTPTDSPIISIDRWHYDEGTADHYKLLADIMSLMPVYAMQFMNCKGTTLAPIDPDPTINRERRKAGLKPFLRYHTINIEPMKTVLRAEGGIETNGLEKALHICRGHFKTYATSYMGRPLDKPLTFWVPSHVKGTAKHGVVVSDYNVESPA